MPRPGLIPATFDFLAGGDADHGARRIEGDASFAHADAQRSGQPPHFELGADVADGAEWRVDRDRTGGRVRRPRVRDRCMRVDVDSALIERNRPIGEHPQARSRVEADGVSRREAQGHAAALLRGDFGAHREAVAGTKRRGRLAARGPQPRGV